VINDDSRRASGTRARALKPHGTGIRQPAGQVPQYLVNQGHVEPMNGPISPGVVGRESEYDGMPLAASLLHHQWHAFWRGRQQLRVGFSLQSRDLAEPESPQVTVLRIGERTEYRVILDPVREPVISDVGCTVQARGQDPELLQNCICPSFNLVA